MLLPQILLLLIVTLSLGQSARALSTAFSRRNLFSKLAKTTTGGIVVTASTCPKIAWAVPETGKPKKRPAFRGGNKAITDTHNGTELNDKEASVAGGLLEKMGMKEIEPYKDTPKSKSSKTLTLPPSN